jgi:tetratricopeptide (TPR) repeat protein
VEFDPDYAPAHAGLAKALKQYLDFSRAAPDEFIPDIEASLERALELDPHDPDALTTRGKMYWGRDVEKARTYWRRALAVNPNDSDAYRWLGYSYRATEPTLYLENIQSGYRVNPTNAFMNNHMVIALINFGRLDEALAVARDFHRLHPDAWQPYAWAARILAFQGRRADSLKIYYRAFQQDPESMRYNFLLWHLIDHISAPYELIYLCLQFWKDREGGKYLDLGTDLGPEAAYYLVSGQPQKAVQFLTDAWKKGAESAWLLAYVALRATHDYASAREFYERAAEELGFELNRFDPEIWRWDIYTDLALVFKQTGDPVLASALLQDTVEYGEFLIGEQILFGPGDHHLSFHLVMLHAVAGRPQQAIAALRDAMASGYHVCGACLRVFPHFNTLRGVEPEFDALVAENEARNAAAIQRLDAEDMLLSPEEVLALDPIEFDPFAN